VSKCPQHIAIPDEIEKVAHRFEPLWMRAILRIVAKVMG
jgi:predicted aldo/keto reductase-like oxidoreductase